MECEVLRKTDSVDDALEVIRGLSVPVCIIVFGDETADSELVYKEITKKASHKIAIMGKGTAVWSAVKLVNNNRNALLRLKRETYSPGELRKAISGVRAEVGDKPYLVGVFIQKVNSARYDLTAIGDSLNCLIKITTP